jgi:uncharacterized membrane protein YkvI
LKKATRHKGIEATRRFSIPLRAKNSTEDPLNQMKYKHLQQARCFRYYYKTIDMKAFYGLILMLMTMFYTGCAAIETIFKVGMWWGIILVVGVIALIFFIISKFTGRR